MVVFCCQATHAMAEFDVTDARDRYSYGLGYSLGKQLGRSQKGFDKASFLKGVDDGREQITPLVDEQEMMALTGQNGLKVLRLRGEKKHSTLVSRQELNHNRRMTGKAFLSENAKREGVVTLPSGLQYLVLVEGDGPIPHLHSEVDIQYRVKTLDGGNMGKSLDTKETVSRPVSGLIKGLSEAVQLMPSGSTWRLFIPPELAYGRRGKLAYQTVVMDLELVSVN